MAKAIKLSGREMGIMRCIGFGLGVSGQELHERTQIEPEELADVLNTLIEIGYVETASMKEKVTVEQFPTETFEINPSYASDLKSAMRR